VNPPALLNLACQVIPFAILLPAESEVVLERVGEIVRINELVPGVVGRIDIDALEPSGEFLFEGFEREKIVASWRERPGR